MHQNYLDLSQEECLAIQRKLELECYACLVNAIRVQGPLTDEGRKLLKLYQEAFSISTERHKAEVRRAVNDEKLTTVSDKLFGEDTSHEWIIEGRRLIPPLPRRPPITLYTDIADEAAEAQKKLNDAMPNPEDTGSDRLSRQGLNSAVAALNKALQQDDRMSIQESLKDIKDVRHPEAWSKEQDRRKQQFTAPAQNQKSYVRPPVTSTATRTEPSPGQLHTRAAHHRPTMSQPQRMPGHQPAPVATTPQNPNQGMMRLAAAAAGIRMRQPADTQNKPTEQPRAAVRLPMQSQTKTMPNILRSPTNNRPRPSTQPMVSSAANPAVANLSGRLNSVQSVPRSATGVRPQSPHMIQLRSKAPPSAQPTSKDEPKITGAMRLVAKTMPGAKVSGSVVVMTSPGSKVSSSESGPILSSTRILNLPAGTRLVSASTAASQAKSGPAGQPGVVTISPRSLQLASKQAGGKGGKTNVIVVHKTQAARPATAASTAVVHKTKPAITQSHVKHIGPPGTHDTFQKDFLTFIDAKGESGEQRQVLHQPEPADPSASAETAVPVQLSSGLDDAQSDAQAVSALLAMRSGSTSQEDSGTEASYTVGQMAELLSGEGDIPLTSEGGVVFLQQDEHAPAPVQQTRIHAPKRSSDEAWGPASVRLLSGLMNWKPYGHVETEPLPAHWFMQEGTMKTHTNDVKKLSVNLSDILVMLQSGSFHDISALETAMYEIEREVKDLYPTGHPAYQAWGVIYSRFHNDLAHLKMNLGLKLKKKRLE